MSGTLWAPLQRKTRAAAQRQLLRLETQVKGPNCRTRTVLTEGVPFYEILQAAKRFRCDLIVLATHGRTGLAHAIMGSVAENVIRRARCPVLTIHPPRFRRGLQRGAGAPCVPLRRTILRGAARTGAVADARKREKSRDLFSKGVAHEFEELAGCL
jgi:hypothetical protein